MECLPPYLKIEHSGSTEDKLVEEGASLAERRQETPPVTQVKDDGGLTLGKKL